MIATPSHHRRLLSIAPIVAVLGFGLALRLGRLGFGLPDFLEEALPLRVALTMKDVATGRVDWNPHYFNYPSLSIYLHLAVQQLTYFLGHLAGHYRTYADYVLSYTIDPTPMVLASRSLGVACDAATIVAAHRLGSRWGAMAGLVAAFLVAASPTLVVTSSSVFSDSLMTALAAWSLERMLTWFESGRGRDLVVAGALLGLAAGAKYPAAALLAPLAVLAVWRAGPRAGLRDAGLAAAVAGLTFFASTPFALLDPAAFWRDFSFERLHATSGHFGSLGRSSFGFHLQNLLANLGWPGSALAGAAVATAVRIPRARPHVAALALALLAFGAPISLASIEADRYALPIVVVAAMLAAIGWHGAAALLRGRTPSWAVAVVLGLVLVPPALGGQRALGRGRLHTQIEARRWCERHLPPEALILQEGYAARLPTFLQKQELAQQPMYRHAGEPARRRLDGVRAYHVVVLPLAVAGRVSAHVGAPGAPAVEVTLLDHASDFSAAFYDPALVRGVDYVMTSDAVRSRYQSDPGRYRQQAGFYAFLDRSAEVVARFDPDARTEGPGIVVYRLRPDTPAAAGLVDSLWWTRALPADHCERLARALRTSSRWSVPDPPAESRACRAARSEIFRSRVEPFAVSLAGELAVLGRDDAAAAMARAILAAAPSSVEACAVLSVSLGRTRRWSEVLEAVDRARAARGEDEREPVLDLLHARALRGLGRTMDARRELLALASSLPAGHPVEGQARADLEQLATPSRPRGAARIAAVPED